VFKKIAVVTGSRAEYGLLYWLMKEIKNDPDCQLQLIVSGMHLSHEFGLTYKKIIEDGFVIDEKLEMLLSSDTSIGITKSIGLGIIGFADVYARLNPDIVVLLGDRFETFAAAQAAFIANIPIAHIHGGELTMGAYDDGMRHSITKMAHLHFVATEIYRQRVMQLGEAPERVFHTGAMVLDSIQKMNFLEKKDLEEGLQIKFNQLNFAVTYLPETLAKTTTYERMNALLEALAAFKEATIFFTRTNADTDGRIINDMIDAFCEKDPARFKAFTSLGHHRYLSLLKHVDMVIGNSSSAVLEAPYFKVPTVNIGDRQKGRILPASIINCVDRKESIQAAIEKGLSPEFKNSLSKMVLPYGEGKVAEKILNIIKKNDREILKKGFYDLQGKIA